MNSLFNKNQSSGFGMLDALIGLLILSLVGVSFHSTMTTGIQSTDKIRKKLIASWVAENRITEMKLSARYTGQIDLDEQETSLAGFDWVTQASVEKNTTSLVRISVNVMESNGSSDSLYDLNTYLPASLIP